LDLAPTAEDFIHREQLDLGEVFSVLLFDLNQTRAIKVLGGNFLACRTIEVFQIRLRESAGSALIGYFVNYRDRRLGKNTDRRNGDLELVRAKLLKCEKRLVLPRDQHVANVAFYKRGCRTARAGVEHGNVFVKCGDEFLGFGFALALFSKNVPPRSEIIPPGAPRRLGIRCDHGNPRLDEIIPIPNALWVPLANQKNDRRGIRGTEPPWDCLIETDSPVLIFQYLANAALKS